MTTHIIYTLTLSNFEQSRAFLLRHADKTETRLATSELTR